MTILLEILFHFFGFNYFYRICKAFPIHVRSIRSYFGNVVHFQCGMRGCARERRCAGGSIVLSAFGPEIGDGSEMCRCSWDGLSVSEDDAH